MSRVVTKKNINERGKCKFVAKVQNHISNYPRKSSVLQESLIKTVVIMDIVVDMLGMYDKEGRFLPKEIAVVALNQPFMMHWLVEPPYPFSELSADVRRRNDYLTRHYHGLEWYEGDVSCKQVYANLREIARHSRFIHTRGEERAELLRNVTTREVIDLGAVEEPMCPDTSILPRTCNNCMRHALGNMGPNTRCALKRVFALKKWYNDTMEMIENGSTPESEEEEEEKRGDTVIFECDGCDECSNKVSEEEVTALDFSMV